MKEKSSAFVTAKKYGNPHNSQGISPVPHMEGQNLLYFSSISCYAN